MRNLYIHIGQPKTGSSTIQRFLVDNRAGLRAAGLGLGPYMTLASGKSLPLRQAIRRHGLAHVMGALAASEGEHIVISSEHLCDVIADPARAAAIRDAARPHFNPVVVVFVRRQDYWHESLYSQEVKTCYAGSIGDFARDYAFGYDYDGGIAGLERVFGAGNVRVALFRDAGGDPNVLLTDFLAALDLPPGAGTALARTGRRNASPHRRKVLFLAQVPKPDPTIQDLSGFMTGVVEKTAAIAADDGRFLADPAARLALVAPHLEGNRALVERYGLRDAAHFVSPPDPAADWRPPRPISGRERRAVLNEALRASVRLPGRRFALRMTARVASLHVRMR